MSAFIVCTKPHLFSSKQIDLQYDHVTYRFPIVNRSMKSIRLDPNKHVLFLYHMPRQTNTIITIAQVLYNPKWYIYIYIYNALYSCMNLNFYIVLKLGYDSCHLVLSLTWQVNGIYLPMCNISLTLFWRCRIAVTQDKGSGKRLYLLWGCFPFLLHLVCTL